MPRYVITQREVWHTQYVVEADSEEAAREVFYEGGDTTELKSQLQEGEIASVEPASDED